MGSVEKIRLHVFLSRAGIASRRKCEELISQGRVRLNGAITRELGLKIDPAKDYIEFDGTPVSVEEKKTYIALNKPEGYLTSNYDPFGRPLGIDLLADYSSLRSLRLFHVGRLDYSSKGLIFYTNDGVFADIVAHPSGGFEKEYLVETELPVTDDQLGVFTEGLYVGKEYYRCERYSIMKPNLVTLVLVEGKNREIRKVFDYFSLPIVQLTRTRIGIVTIKGIREGGFRRLTAKEISYFTNNRKQGGK